MRCFKHRHPFSNKSCFQSISEPFGMLEALFSPIGKPKQKPLRTWQPTPEIDGPHGCVIARASAARSCHAQPVVGCWMAIFSSAATFDTVPAAWFCLWVLVGFCFGVPAGWLREQCELSTQLAKNGSLFSCVLIGVYITGFSKLRTIFTHWYVPIAAKSRLLFAP